MTFKYLLGRNAEAPVGFINSNFVVEIEQIVHRNIEGTQLRVHLLTGRTVIVHDEYAEKILRWYEAQTAAGEAEDEAPARPVKRGGRQAAEMATASA